MTSSTLTPVEMAERLGHTVENDPPAALTATERWTCKRCGSAVLRAGTGNVYGSAVEETCDEAMEFWQAYREMKA